MKRENITIGSIMALVSFIVGLLGATTINPNYIPSILVVGIGAIIILWYIGQHYFTDIIEDLSLTSRLHPSNSVVRSRPIRLLWDVTNNTNKKIDIIDYLIRPRKEDRVIFDHGWNQRDNFTIPPRKTIPIEWDWVLPHKYSLGIRGDGEYFLDSILEYKKRDGEKILVMDSITVNVLGDTF